MRIGIDCRTILNPNGGEKAGVGYYTYYLVKGLVETYPIDKFVLFFEASAREVAKEFEKPNTEIVILPPKGLPVIYSHWTLAGIFKKAKLDILHCPANVCPLGYSGKIVVTVHDLAIYKYPEWFPKGQWLATKIVVPQSIRRATKIIAVSKSTQRDIIEIFKISPAKIIVIYEGVDLEKFKPAENRQQVFEAVKQKYGISKSYFLFIGTLQPRKNLVRLIEAWNYSREWLSGYQLVLAGDKGWDYEEIFQKVKELNLESEIIFPGYVNDLKLLQAAEVFVFPSLYEGFGLPVLEALACGVPVITSNISSLPEVGGQEVTYVNPESVEDISQALKNLKKPNRVWAENFSWQKTAQLTRELYDA